MICKNCRRDITTKDGVWYLHEVGTYSGKMRCNPEDTGQPYGLEAEPLVLG